MLRPITSISTFNAERSNYEIDKRSIVDVAFDTTLPNMTRLKAVNSIASFENKELAIAVLSQLSKDRDLIILDWVKFHLETLGRSNSNQEYLTSTFGEMDIPNRDLRDKIRDYETLAAYARLKVLDPTQTGCLSGASSSPIHPKIAQFLSPSDLEALKRYGMEPSQGLQPDIKEMAQHLRKFGHDTNDGFLIQAADLFDGLDLNNSASIVNHFYGVQKQIIDLLKKQKGDQTNFIAELILNGYKKLGAQALKSPEFVQALQMLNEEEVDLLSKFFNLDLKTYLTP